MPYESLKRVSRERKYYIDDLQELVTAIKLLAEKTSSEAERKQSIDSLVQRASMLKTEVRTWRSEASKLIVIVKVSDDLMFRPCIRRHTRHEPVHAA